MEELDDVRDFDGTGVYLAACKRSDDVDALQVLLDSRFPCRALEAPTGEGACARPLLLVFLSRPLDFQNLCLDPQTSFVRRR